MATSGEVEHDILEDLERRGPCSIEEMVTHLSGYTWNQVFSAVDRLSRCAKVTLQHPSRFGYQIALAQVRHPDTPITEVTGRHRLAGQFEQAGTTMAAIKA